MTFFSAKQTYSFELPTITQNYYKLKKIYGKHYSHKDILEEKKNSKHPKECGKIQN